MKRILAVMCLLLVFQMVCQATAVKAGDQYLARVFADYRPVVNGRRYDGYVWHGERTVYAMSGESCDMTGLQCTRRFVGYFNIRRRTCVLGRCWYYTVRVRGYQFSCTGSQ